MDFLDIVDIQLFWIILWSIVIIVALVVELAGPELISIWFMVGGIVSLVLAIFNVNWGIQIGVFIFTSVLAIFVSRLFYKKKISQEPTFATNLDRLLGEDILVLTPVNINEQGSGRYRDVVWTLITEDDTTFSKNELAVIVKIRGNKIIIKKKEGN